MQCVSFVAQEYQRSAVFEQREYRFEGSEGAGWNIYRQGVLHLSLPSGYHLVRTR